MKQASRPVFGDLFAFPEVLPAPVRLRLSALLAAPGRPTAILPRQLASSPLPDNQEAPAEIRRLIEAGLQTIENLVPHRLDEIVPALARDPGATDRYAPAKLRLLLEKKASGAPLAKFTVRQISAWPGVGPRRVAQLIGAAVGAALEVVAAQQYMLFSSTAQSDRRLTALTAALAAGGDERDCGVFENLVLPLGTAVTRLELADALGIGPQRVRQLAAQAADRVRVAVKEAPTAVGEIAKTVFERLGAAAPRDAVDQALASLGFPALPDTRSRLLLWMAGPYREVDGHPGWVAVDPAGLVGQTRRLIHEDGGVRPVDHVTKDLRLEGVVPQHVGDWLARQPVRVGDGLVVATTGAPGDVAERALHAHGRAMTVDEIATWVHGVPEGFKQQGFKKNRAKKHGFEELRSAGDRRFVVTSGEALALVEWGADL